MVDTASKNEALLKRFYDFLEIEGNDNIVFSAPFGEGKTYFINRFSEKYNQEFHFFKLFPVAYSASQNQDIFEQIKYDILIQILANEELNGFIDSEGITLSLSVQMTMLELFKPKNIASTIASYLENKSSAELKLISKILKEIINDYNDVKKTDLEKIYDFLNLLESNSGHSYEYDGLSKIISTCLSNSRKKTVLVIDDLDRLDPDQLFRILNILTSYSDLNSAKNKLGFKKTILVCDIENIRSVYRHKYGQKTDFAGFMNKFYSKGIYEFSNREFAKEFITNRTETIRFSFANETYLYKRGDNAVRRLPDVIFFVVVTLFFGKKISLRTLVQIDTVDLNQSNLNPSLKHLTTNIDWYGLWLVLFLNKSFVTKELLFDALSDIANANFSLTELDEFLSSKDCANYATRLLEFVLPWLITAHSLLDGYQKCSQNSRFHYSFKFFDNPVVNDIEIKYRVTSSSTMNHYTVEIINYNEIDQHLLHLSFEGLLRLSKKFLI